MSESLRDTIANAVEEHVPTEAGVDPGKVVEGTIPPETPAPAEKPGRTAGRARDEAGKLLPGKPEKKEARIAPEFPRAPSTAASARILPISPTDDPSV